VNMKTRAIIIVATVLMAIPTIGRAGQQVGVNSINIPAQTDVYVSVPFTQRSEGTFTVTGTSGSDVNFAEATQAGAFANRFYLRFTSGPADGKWATITANGTNSATVADASVLAGVVAGNTFKVYRHQTFDTVFPSNFKGISYTVSLSLFARTFEVLIPTTGGATINRPAGTVYFHFNGTWRKSPGSPAVDAKFDIIPPQQLLILRNNNNSALTYYSFGDIELNEQTAPIVVQSSDNDIAISTGQPVPVTLSQLMIGGTAAWKDGVSVFNLGDEIQLRNNAAAGKNKPAAIIYFRLNGAWRQTPGSPTVSVDDVLLPPGAAFFIRKDGGTPATEQWTQTSPLN